MTIDQVAILVVGLIGALGVGTSIGAVIQSRSAAANLDKQLAHDIETRKLDHAHDLEVRRLEDRQRLRDQRLARLREGFLLLVQALLELEEVLDAMSAEATENVKGNDLQRWRRLLGDANLKAEQARPGLLLEKLGESAIRRYVQLGRMLALHRLHLDDVELGRRTSSPDLPASTDAYRRSEADITKAIVEQIRLAQESLEQLEAPITLSRDETAPSR